MPQAQSVSCFVMFAAGSRYETPEIGARTTRVGTKSFDLEHEIRAQDGRLVAEAQSTLVAFDYDADQTMPIPPEWRERIENYESRSAAAT